MKKLFALAIIALISTVSFAQTARPDKLDDENIDKFIASSFDLNDKKIAYGKEVATLDSTLKVLEAANKKVDKATLDAGEARIKAVEEGYKTLSSDLQTLLGQSGDVVTKATEISPKTKVMKATKAVKSAVAVLNSTKDGLTADMKTAGEVKVRFEKLKALNVTK